MSRTNRWEERMVERLERRREAVIRPPRRWEHLSHRPFERALEKVTAKEAFEALFMPPKVVEIKGRLPK